MTTQEKTINTLHVGIGLYRVDQFHPDVLQYILDTPDTQDTCYVTTFAPLNEDTLTTLVRNLFKHAQEAGLTEGQGEGTRLLYGSIFRHDGSRHPYECENE